jgi:hypothetical protein
MTMPGFSAETPLDSISEQYRVIADRAEGTGGQQVVPQQVLVPPSWNEFCTPCDLSVSSFQGWQTCCRKTPFGWVCWRRFCEIPR